MRICTLVESLLKIERVNRSMTDVATIHFKQIGCSHKVEHKNYLYYVFLDTTVLEFYFNFLSKYRPLSSEQGKFCIILVNYVKCSHRH